MEAEKAKIKVAPQAPGRVKVQLRFLTSKPRHLRSLLLAQSGAEPPYVEDVCVLLPHMRVFPAVEAYLPPFEALKRSGAVPEDSELQGFRVVDHDRLTLSYVL